MVATKDGQVVQLPALVVSVKTPDGNIQTAPLLMERLLVGTSRECDLTVKDARVSRQHLDLCVTPQGIWLRDLGSKNGTKVGKLLVFECILALDETVSFGGSELVVRAEGAPKMLAMAPSNHFGKVLGESFAMRVLFAKLLRASPTDETILLLGESGTGKEVLAQEIHRHSLRKQGPFVVFDCSAVAPNLLEAEVFGHARGAFSGAVGQRTGLFEEANGGTLFLDEIGELPLELQPKLLRALESRKVRALGTNVYKSVDVRVIAATHRNLKAKVAEGLFREDLYYRLAVVEVNVPPLRDRKEDISLLMEYFLSAMTPPRKTEDLPPHAREILRSHDWPGNVRELRNMVARLVLFPDLLEELAKAQAEADGQRAPEASPDERAIGAQGPRMMDHFLKMPLLQGREMLVEQFERRYIQAKMAEHKNNISKAADAMEISRQLLHRLIDKYGLKSK